jgi:hypothetical protein
MTKHKTFRTEVEGNWKPVSFLGCSGKWFWKEAKDKLLQRFDAWKTDRMEILSIHWKRSCGAYVEDGASLALDIIYEELNDQT